MKKGISEKKVQRMRNLVTGNYSAKTITQSGYKQKTIKKHGEGDIWEEKDKVWTIKNGIKQTVTKLDKAREMVRIPLHCPKCEIKMLKSQHKFMYKRFGHCLFCQTNAENQLRNDGKYDEWRNKEISKNFESWLYRSKEEFKDWLIDRKAKHQITEAGDIEDWRGGKSDETLIEEFDIYIQQEKKKLTNTLSTKKD